MGKMTTTAATTNAKKIYILKSDFNSSASGSAWTRLCETQVNCVRVNCTIFWQTSVTQKLCTQQFYRTNIWLTQNDDDDDDDYFIYYWLHNQTLFFLFHFVSIARFSIPPKQNAQQYRRHANLQLRFVRWESIDLGPIHWAEHSKWFRLSIFECDLVFIVSHAQNGIHESNLHVLLAPSAGHVNRLIVNVRGPATTFAQSLQENPQILKRYFLLLHKRMGKLKCIRYIRNADSFLYCFSSSPRTGVDVYEYKRATIMEENR